MLMVQYSHLGLYKATAKPTSIVVFIESFSLTYQAILVYSATFKYLFVLTLCALISVDFA